jgi:hypothetical protein
MYVHTEVAVVHLSSIQCQERLLGTLISAVQSFLVVFACLKELSTEYEQQADLVSTVTTLRYEILTEIIIML